MLQLNTMRVLSKKSMEKAGMKVGKRLEHYTSRVMVNLPPELGNEVALIAKSENTTLVEIFRKAIRAFVDLRRIDKFEMSKLAIREIEEKSRNSPMPTPLTL